MELLEDYDFSLHYHLGKDTMEVDALTRKTSSMLACLRLGKWKMLNFVCDFDLCVDELGGELAFCNLVSRPTLIEKIIEAQLKDARFVDIMGKLSNGELMEGWHMNEKKGLRLMGRLCVPHDAKLKE